MESGIPSNLIGNLNFDIVTFMHNNGRSWIFSIDS